MTFRKSVSYTVQNTGIKIVYSDRAFDTEYHEHDFLELAYIVSGKAKHIIDGNSMHIEKGDYFIVDYNTTHKYETYNNRPFALINCMFSPKLIDETLHKCHHFEDIATSYQVNVNYRNLDAKPTKFLYHDENGTIFHILKMMLEEYEIKDLGCQEILKSYMIQLLIKTMRKIKLPTAENLDNNMVQHIIKYVQKHYHEKISLEEIAKKYGYSLSYISRIFKNEVGMTFQEYVQSIRIQESYRLLINTSKKVLDIAMSVGYSDVRFFYDIFKKQTGMTPTQYRKAYIAEKRKDQSHGN